MHLVQVIITNLADHIVPLPTDFLTQMLSYIDEGSEGRGTRETAASINSAQWN